MTGGHPVVGNCTWLLRLSVQQSCPGFLASVVVLKLRALPATPPEVTGLSPGDLPCKSEHSTMLYYLWSSQQSILTVGHRWTQLEAAMSSGSPKRVSNFEAISH